MRELGVIGTGEAVHHWRGDRTVAYDSPTFHFVGAILLASWARVIALFQK